KEDRDRYQYDTFLNAKWGSDPEKVFSDLGLTKKQIARQNEDQNAKSGYPKGTFSYKITKKSSLYGVPVSAELLFADNLYGLPQHIGLYAVKVIFLEDFPETFSANSEQREPKDYKLDGEKAIEEINKRSLYNTVESSAQEGDWSVHRWESKTTPMNVSSPKQGALCKAIESISATFSVDTEKLKEASLSSMQLYYNNSEHYSYMIYNGFNAALLRNME
ncbi:MAG: hypothetical protein RR977_03855, partial [Oscillospiraceae bacterium]